MKKVLTQSLLLAALLAGSHNVLAENTTMNITATQHAPAGLQQLIDRHFAIWNNTDAVAREKAFALVYTPDFFVADEHGLNEGADRVNATIDNVQSQHPGFIFTPAAVEWNHGIARVTWGYGPKENPNLVRGEDIFTVSAGRLSSARVFSVNSAAMQSFFFDYPPMCKVFSGFVHFFARIYDVTVLTARSNQATL